jgi:hypothetical protein
MGAQPTCFTINTSFHVQIFQFEFKEVLFRSSFGHKQVHHLQQRKNSFELDVALGEMCFKQRLHSTTWFEIQWMRS